MDEKDAKLASSMRGFCARGYECRAGASPNEGEIVSVAIVDYVALEVGSIAERKQSMKLSASGKQADSMPSGSIRLLQVLLAR